MPGGIDPAGTLSVIPLRSRLGDLPCPGTANARWDFQIDYVLGKDKKTNRNILGAPCDGWIVQEVYYECKFNSCKKPRVISNVDVELDLGEESYHYWEAWPVTKGQRLTNNRAPKIVNANTNLALAAYTDEAMYNFGDSGYGVYKQFGEVTFYCDSKFDDPTGQNIGVGDEIRKWKPKPRGYGKNDNCKTSPGQLISTPDRPGFLFHAPVDGPASRSMIVSWDCCFNCPRGYVGGHAVAFPSLE